MRFEKEHEFKLKIKYFQTFCKKKDFLGNTAAEFGIYSFVGKRKIEKLIIEELLMVSKERQKVADRKKETCYNEQKRPSKTLLKKKENVIMKEK